MELDEVKKIAVLARLDLTDKETALLASQLGEILNYVERLSALPLEGVEPLSHPLTLANVLRKDTPSTSLDAPKALDGAPDSERGFFRVPKILD